MLIGIPLPAIAGFQWSVADSTIGRDSWTDLSPLCGKEGHGMPPVAGRQLPGRSPGSRGLPPGIGSEIEGSVKLPDTRPRARRDGQGQQPTPLARHLGPDGGSAPVLSPVTCRNGAQVTIRLDLYHLIILSTLTPRPSAS